MYMQILLIILILIVRIGNAFVPDPDGMILTCGTLLGCIINVFAHIINYMIGAGVTVLEALITGISVILLIAVGGISLNYGFTTDNIWEDSKQRTYHTSKY